MSLRQPPEETAFPAVVSIAEKTIEYMKTREVYRCDHGSIVVDGFRYTAAYLRSFVEPMRGGTAWKARQCAPRGHGVASAAPLAPNVYFFLTHFHSDHYTGIDGSWRHGAIYASDITAALVVSQLGVDPSLVRPLQMHQSYVFSLHGDGGLSPAPDTATHPTCHPLMGCAGVTPGCLGANGKGGAPAAQDPSFSVTLVPANHCPGSAMLIFMSTQTGCIVHTGDFRYNGARDDPPSNGTPAGSSEALVDGAGGIASTLAERHQPVPLEQHLGDDPVLRGVAGNVRTLFLDNTFCDVQYNFPSQASILAWVVEAIRDKMRQHAHQKAVRPLDAAGGDTKIDPDLLHVASPSKESAGLQRVARVAVLVGTYVIGKERLAMAVQQAFRPRDGGPKPIPIHVSPSKWAVLQAAGLMSDANGVGPLFDSVPAPLADPSGAAPDAALGPDPGAPDPYSSFPLVEVAEASVRGALVSTAPWSDRPATGAPVFLSLILAPLMALRYPSLAAADKGAAAQPLLPLWPGAVLDLSLYDAVVAVEPTGWVKKCRQTAVSHRTTLLSVPYSEHSSFEELLRFVQFLEPEIIVPTVSRPLYEKHEARFAEQTHRLRIAHGGTRPLAHFFTSTTSSSATASTTALSASRKRPRSSPENHAPDGANRSRSTRPPALRPNLARRQWSAACLGRSCSTSDREVELVRVLAAPPPEAIEVSDDDDDDDGSGQADSVHCID